MTLFANTIPVTAASPPGGRPRRGAAPANAFAAWLAGQSRSVKQIADELGLAKWSIYHLRNGYHQPSLEVAKRIAELSRPLDQQTGELGPPAVPADSWPPPLPRPSKPKVRKSRSTARPTARKSNRRRRS